VAEVKHCYRHPDRETGLSCSECDRPICVDCMTVAPVGIRCPDHAGGPSRSKLTPQRAVRTARHQVREGAMTVTKILVAINVLVYLAELGEGAGINATSGWIFEHCSLVARAQYGDGTLAGVAHGEWWRLITAAFLHYGPIHLGMNMLALWWLGTPVEMVLGRTRFLLLYLASGLAGSAGALVWSPNAITVGASGAIFGMLGAGLILEYRATGSLGGNYLTLIIINLGFTLVFAGNISVGGHVGGLIAGILGTLVIVNVGRAYRQLDPALIGLVALGAVSVVIAYWKVRGLA
jgi:membrane associated rhomboid family serine protease